MAKVQREITHPTPKKLKSTLQSCGINPYSFEQHDKNRYDWRSLCKQDLNSAELKRTEKLVAKRV